MDNMRMCQASNGAGLGEKLLKSSAAQTLMHDLDGCWRLQIHMLAQIDLSEATSPQQFAQAIIARLRPNPPILVRIAPCMLYIINHQQQYLHKIYIQDTCISNVKTTIIVKVLSLFSIIYETQHHSISIPSASNHATEGSGAIITPLPDCS